MADEINPVLGNLAKDPKATEDFSKECEEVLARANTLSGAGRVDEAAEEICTLEKRCRTSNDGPSCSKLLCGLTKLYFEAGNWAMLREYLIVMSKKRGQMKRAITDMVLQAMGWLEQLEQAKKTELIETLNEITEGKIFLEVEKARLTKMQADMKEAEGDISEAANLLQEVQVETFTAMDRTEKTEYILDQMRLVLLKKDFIRCQIISKKLNPKLLDAEDFQDLKIRYFEYMVQYWLHEGKHLDVAKSYSALMNTKKVRDDEVKIRAALTAHAAYLCMAMFDNEQEDMLNKVSTMEAKALEKVPVFQRLIKMFLRLELMPWPLPFEADLKAHEVFTNSPHEGGEERWKLLKKRVVQHNIKVISTYYDHIHSARLAELIGMDPKDTELEVSELVSSKFVFAKINRPAGIVKFGQKEDCCARLNDWSGSISKMLDLVENTCHLIQKEQMVHAARAKIKAKK